MQQNTNGVIKVRARLSYVHLLQPYASPSASPGTAKAKYSTTLLIPKSDAQAKAVLDAAIQAAIQNGVSNRWNGQRPNVLAIPIHDGDGPRPSDGAAFGVECKGCWVMTASSDQAPQVVNQRVELITNPSEVYSGMWANVSIRFFAYLNNGKKGIGCGLGNVQKIADGEALGGRTTAYDDFDTVADESATFTPAPGYGQPATGQPAYGQPPAGYQQPQYAQQPQQQPQYAAPAQQPQYAPAAPAQQPQQPQINPLTGLPMDNNIMGI